MNLRKLQTKDIPFMLEWMKDIEINRQFRTDFSHFTEDKVKNFIEQAQDFSVNRYYAIVDDHE